MMTVCQSLARLLLRPGLRHARQPSPTARLAGLLPARVQVRLARARPRCITGSQTARSPVHSSTHLRRQPNYGKFPNLGGSNLPTQVVAITLKKSSRSSPRWISTKLILGPIAPHSMPIRLVRMTELNSEPPSLAGLAYSLPQTQIDRLVSGKLSRGTLHCETDHPSVHSSAVRHECSGPIARPRPSWEPDRFKKGVNRVFRPSGRPDEELMILGLHVDVINCPRPALLSGILSEALQPRDRSRIVGI